MRRGFSLLELLIYMAVLAIVIVGIASVFIAIEGGNARNNVQTEVNSNLRFAIEKIEDDLRAATSITTPASAGATSTTLVLVNASSGTVTYCLTTSTLRRQTGGAACTGSSDAVTASTVLVATSTFTRLENTNTVLNKTVVSVQADIVVSYNGSAPEDLYSEEKITTVALRN